MGKVAPQRGLIMKSTRELLGARIKELRKARKLSQEELAELIGVEPQHLSRIEGGRGFPSLDRLEKLAVALKVGLADFFDFAHLEDADERLDEINGLVKGLNEEQQRFVHRLLKAMHGL